MKASLIIAVLLCSSLAWGQANVNENLETAFIYVDASTGSDSNPGTQGQPLRTITKAASMAMSNNYNSVGTRVIINPGTYRESVSVRSSSRSTSLPITFQAATNGTVFVSGADVWTGWTPDSGNPSIYTQSWPFQWGLCPGNPGAPTQQDIILRQEMIVVNGTPLTEVLSFTAMQPGTFLPDEANATVYVWPPTGTDMGTAMVEVATRPMLFNVGGQSYVVLRGLTFQYANSCKQNAAVGIGGNATNVLIDSDNFLWNNATGLGVKAAQNFTVQSSVASHNGALGFNTHQVKNGQWESDTASYNNWRGAQGAFYHWDTGNKFMWEHNSTFNNVKTFFNQAPGVWFDTDDADITAKALISVGNLSDGVFVEKSEGPLSISNSYVCANNPLNLGAEGLGLRNSSSVSLSGNTLFGNTGTQLSVVGQAGGISVTNWETGQTYNLQTENLTMSQNTVVGNGAARTFMNGYLGGTDWSVFASTLASDQNTWWADTGTKPFNVPVPKNWTTLDLGGWQSLTGQDTNSTWASSASPAACNVQSQGPDYWLLTSTYNPVTASPSGQAVYNLTTMALGGMTGTVTLGVDGLAAIPGVTGSFSPGSIKTSGTSVLTLNTSQNTPPGTYPVTIVGNSGSLTRTVTVSLIVPSTSVWLSTTSLTFPGQNVGTTSSPQTVTLTNIGNQPLTISSISVDTNFGQTNTCGTTVAAGASCAINVTFSPTALGTLTGHLTLSDDDLTSPQVVSLSGTGLGAVVAWTPTSLTFAGQKVNTTSPAQAVTLSNTGNAAMTITSIATTGNFAQTNNCGTSLAAGASCTVNVTFTPTGTGTRNGNVTIKSNAISNPSVSLTGTGLGAVVTWTPKSLTFKGQVVNTTSPAQSVSLKNTGNAVMAITSIGTTGDFAQTNNCGASLAAGSSCTVKVTFTPKATGTRNGSVTIKSNAISNPSVSLTGTGLRG